MIPDGKRAFTEESQPSGWFGSKLERVSGEDGKPTTVKGFALPVGELSQRLDLLLAIGCLRF